MADYYQILRRALQEAPNASPQMRNEVYNRAHQALQARLKEVQPAPVEADLLRGSQLFREAVARIEGEIAAAVQKAAVGQNPGSPKPQLTVVGGTVEIAGSAQEVSIQEPGGEAEAKASASARPAVQPVPGAAPKDSASPQGAPATAVAPPSPTPPPAKKKITSGDEEFLPAALEILETPPSPVQIRMLSAICLFVVVAFGWAYFGYIDIVAIAQGKFQPTGRVNVVQPVETGKVRAIHVSNGSVVKEGQVLVEMDPTDAQSDVTGQSALLSSLEAEIVRRQAANETYRTRSLDKPVAITWPANVSLEARQREQGGYDSDIAQLRAVVASLSAQRIQKEAEQSRIAATITAQEQFLRTLKERVDMRQALVARAAGARANVIDALEKLNEQETQLAAQRGQSKEVEASLIVLGREIEKNFQAAETDNGQRLLQAYRQRDDVEQRLAKANARLRNTFLRAPTSGVVQAVSIINIGQVVAAGEQIMRLVPDGMGLEIEGYIQNKDIGFIKEGQEATIKVDSFPFTKWGTIDAKVVKIARDAIPLPEASQMEANPGQAQRATVAGGAQRTQNLVYQITLKPLQDKIGPENDRIQLMPGMTVTLEIKTGNRRIISYLFTPLVEVGSAGMRER